MLTQRSVINKVRKIATEIRQTGLHLHKVVLYGSYASDTQHNGSDIDIALVADEFTSIGFDDVGLFVKVLMKYRNLDIQPRTYNTRDFSPDVDPFVDEILRTGIEIV